MIIIFIEKKCQTCTNTYFRYKRQRMLPLQKSCLQPLRMGLILSLSFTIIAASSKGIPKLKPFKVFFKSMKIIEANFFWSLISLFLNFPQGLWIVWAHDDELRNCLQNPNCFKYFWTWKKYFIMNLSFSRIWSVFHRR